MRLLRLIGINLLVLLLLLLAAELVLRSSAPKLMISRVHEDPSVPRMVSYVSRFGHQVTITPEGFRAVSPPKCTQDEAPVRILLVGDSNILAEFLSDADAPGARLQHHLSEAGTDCFHVDAFGVSGFGPDQSLFAAEAAMQQRSYEFVVLHFFADNDFGDLMRNRNSDAAGALEDRGYCYLDFHFLDQLALWRKVRTLHPKLSPAALDLTVLRHSRGKGDRCRQLALPEFQVRRRADLLTYLERRTALDREIFDAAKSTVYFGDRYDIKLACGEQSVYTQYQRTQLRQVLERFDKRVHAHGAMPIILIQPSEIDTSPRHPIGPALLTAHCEGYDPRRLTSSVIESAQQAKFTGALVALYRNFNNCPECYFSEAEIPGDDHWNGHGVDKGMQVLAGAILGLRSSP